MHHPSTSQSESSALAYMRARMAEADSMFRNGLAAAAQPSDILKLSRTLLDICTEVSDGLNSICKVSPVACRSGCDTCCRSLIQVNPIFARLALDYARRTFTPERLEMLHQRLLTDVTFCPFLFDGACSIYDQRPMVCRG
ncbi:conserved hypothetical protein [Gluconacetobacter diazotrophicus PA1 5]|uniref:Uncharacterized protein n=3 Tax=Gluconacetobacter diazotrophicus TaxID=33996 RepID=A9H2Q7_GLUDA|nr:conserved hypothetical protein [Gluconacetobacter diazotrophicus PA1 5]CAP54187.1 hypothetical protein GDI0244 [Gluconacetobacter diazotrophicus PA1 5]